MREFGASARYLLLAAAAKQWDVPLEECSSDLHKIVHQKSGRELGYGELVEGARQIKLPRGFTPILKRPAQFRYIGKSLPIVDGADITTGKAVYGMDVQVPGMLYAAVNRPPTVGGSVNSYNADAARKIAGVIDIVEIPGPPGKHPGFHPLGGIAVVASNTWAAQQGANALEINWNSGPYKTDESEAYIENLQALSRKPGTPVRQQGDLDTALAAADKIVEAEYVVPYLAHATMEPLVATASFSYGRCEVWAPSQNPQGARQSLAKLLKIDEDQITINVTLLGGGFGRKSKHDFILEAAWVSRVMQKPIKLVWSRPDDIQHDYYHACSAQYLKAGLGPDGRPSAWLHRSMYPAIDATFSKGGTNLRELSMGVVDMPYAIDNVRMEGASPPSPVRIGWLRAVGNIQNAFAVCSFAHELAVAAGRDPAEYLLELLGPDRMVDLGEDTKYGNYGKPLEEFPIDTARLRRVAETAIKASGWGKTLPKGHGMGVAVHRCFLSYVATVVEVSTNESGKIKVERITTAVDVGRIINPDRLRSQMEGGAIFGLSLALHGEITTNHGRVLQSNFHDYPMARMYETPNVDVHLVESDHVPTGAGEPPTPVLAPALCNAIFSATGKRIRRLPLQRHGLV
jgi:isoquinoline 1-oxidoreductase beta subunit